jgi:transcriptional regulator with XRE-family HTH domain
MKKIAEQRKSKGMSQQELADALGVSQNAVSMWETGRRAPSVVILQKIAAALGASLLDLVDPLQGDG